MIDSVTPTAPADAPAPQLAGSIRGYFAASGRSPEVAATLTDLTYALEVLGLDVIPDPATAATGAEADDAPHLTVRAELAALALRVDLLEATVREHHSGKGNK